MVGLHGGDHGVDGAALESVDGCGPGTVDVAQLRVARPERQCAPVHAFQGRAVDPVIAAMEATHPPLTTQKTLYVEISRARDHAELV
ncbi:MAG: hypothetical protein OXF11_01870, partial [Deltaproteobacteria bacterium]|nr:hypothetical protein [Deltaproteobacteria bacterium]